MKIVIEEVKKEEESEVIIRYCTLNDTLRKVIELLQVPEYKLIGEQNKEMYILEPEKIYYAESVDNKVFIYSEKQVYESKKKLYELEQELEKYHFFRASKSMVLNINKIISVHSTFDGRLEARLKNKEKVYISRSYVSVLKQKLGI